MGRRRQRAELVVRMNGHLVGRLVSEPGGRLVLTYDPSWLISERRTPISTSLPLSSAAYSGPEVASFFDNLLPDGEPVRARMQVALDAASTRPFDLLAAAGRDCVGAL
jgi:serine/threonine-protein kinase HipA